jgi:hypothetical protein
MDVFTKDNLKALLGESGTPCISLYLPMLHSMPDAMQNPIRFRNLLNEAERQLNVNGRKAAHSAGILNGARELLNDDDFWRHPSAGLAVFIAPDRFERFRLPLVFDEVLVVADRFHVKPILPFLSGDGRYYILALSQKDVRLFRGTRQSIRELPLERIPRNVAEIMATDSSERTLQPHTRTAGPAGEGSALFHGHAVAASEPKDVILRYFRRIDHGLCELLHSETAPLVLAGVDYLHPLYREVNSYKPLLEKGVSGNPGSWSEEELHQQAWKVVQPHFEQARADALQRYGDAGSLKLAAENIEEILPAAYSGRVDTLFVTSGKPHWGSFNRDTGTVLLERDPGTGSEDLLNLASVQAILSGGTVYVLKPEEMPNGHSVAAVFRY